jgi:hypothetical protein
MRCGQIDSRPGDNAGPISDKAVYRPQGGSRPNFLFGYDSPETEPVRVGSRPEQWTRSATATG